MLIEVNTIKKNIKKDVNEILIPNNLVSLSPLIHFIT